MENGESHAGMGNVVRPIRHAEAGHHFQNLFLLRVSSSIWHYPRTLLSLVTQQQLNNGDGGILAPDSSLDTCRPSVTVCDQTLTAMHATRPPSNYLIINRCSSCSIDLTLLICTVNTALLIQLPHVRRIDG
jgi:hypothetical protein